MEIPMKPLTPALLTPCFGAIWLGSLTELRSPGWLPSSRRGQLAAFSVPEFGGLCGAGGIGSLTQPLLGTGPGRAQAQPRGGRRKWREPQPAG